jgi:hypothetical protein
MIREALVFAVLLLLIEVPALGEWSEIAVSRANGFILYVDPLRLPDEHRIVVSFPYLKQFTQAQVHRGTGRLIRSLIVEAEYDCHLERERVLRTLSYSDEMGRGTVVATEAGDGQWMDIISGNLNALLWKAACH